MKKYIPIIGIWLAKYPIPDKEFKFFNYYQVIISALISAIITYFILNLFI